MVKKSNLSRLTRAAKYVRRRRLLETEEQRMERIIAMRTRNVERRIQSARMKISQLLKESKLQSKDPLKEDNAIHEQAQSHESDEVQDKLDPCEDANTATV